MKVKLTLHKELILQQGDLTLSEEAILEKANDGVEGEDAAESIGQLGRAELEDAIAQLLEDDFDEWDWDLSADSISVEVLS